MLQIEKKDNINIVSFSINKINALIADEIRDEIINVFNESKAKVVINLENIEYIDSSGFGCFLSVMKAARGNYGTLKFTIPGERLMELFKTLHLHTVFELYDDIDSCIKSF